MVPPRLPCDRDGYGRSGIRSGTRPVVGLRAYHGRAKIAAFTPLQASNRTMSNLCAKEQIKKINAKLEEAREAYYKQAAPIMTDAEYDALEKHLQGLVKEYPNLVEYAPVLKTVGDDHAAGERIKHASPMLSIENQYTFEDVLAWCKTLPSNTKIVLEPKFDGISVSLHYRDGQLVQGLTRGTGTEGE